MADQPDRYVQIPQQSHVQNQKGRQSRIRISFLLAGQTQIADFEGRQGADSSVEAGKSLFLKQLIVRQNRVNHNGLWVKNELSKWIVLRLLKAKYYGAVINRSNLQVNFQQHPIPLVLSEAIGLFHNSVAVAEAAEAK